MHAVVVKVTINDFDTAEPFLRNEVVPRVAQSPGFVSGYWTKKDDTGLSMILFESEEQARQSSERVRSMATEGVTIEDVDIREVVAQA